MDLFHRIYRLHGLLANRRTAIPMRAIMAELECSKATATRCIENLRNYLNAPLDYDRKQKGYCYNRHHAGKPFELPGLWFSAEELNGLLICQQILQNISPGILSNQIDRLQQKIQQLFQLHPQPPGDIAQKIQIISIGRRLKDDTHFKRIAAALFNDRQLNITYQARGANGAQTQRIISPQQLLHYRDNWYLAAYCHYRDALRMFAIDNILASRTLTATAHGIDRLQLQKFLTGSYGIFSGVAEHTAVLEFTRERARWVADEQWHPAQHGQWLDNGDYRLSIPFGDSRELLMDILKYGADVTVIAPLFLVEAVKTQIEAMQKNYAK